jgi:hypothetical protein
MPFYLSKRNKIILPVVASWLRWADNQAKVNSETGITTTHGVRQNRFCNGATFGGFRPETKSSAGGGRRNNAEGDGPLVVQEHEQVLATTVCGRWE